MRTFIEEYSDKFNGSSGDVITLYDAAKFTSELHKNWCEEVLRVIAIMKEKAFYEDIILDEVEKRLKKQLKP